jgi:hypothetical protein
MKKVVAYCGAEQEFAEKISFESDWLPGGGRIFLDGSMIETNTGLIPIRDSGELDPSREMFNAMMTDRARLLGMTKKKSLRLASTHLNFPDPGLEMEDILSVTAPSLSFLLGTTFNEVSFRQANGRFEVATGAIHTPASIIAGSAYSIGLLTALRRGELSINDFLFRIPDSAVEVTAVTNRHRHSLKRNNYIYTGRDAEIETLNGKVSIAEILKANLPVIAPYVEKYCSSKGLHLLERVIAGREYTDIDRELMTEDFDEDEEEPLPEKAKIIVTTTRAGLTKATGKKDLLDVMCMRKPTGAAQLYDFAIRNSGKTKNGIRWGLSRLDWDSIILSIERKGQKYSISIPRDNAEAFYFAIREYKSNPDKLVELTSLFSGSSSRSFYLAQVERGQKLSNNQLETLTVLGLANTLGDTNTLTEEGRKILDLIDPIYELGVDDLENDFFKFVFREKKPKIMARAKTLQQDVSLLNRIVGDDSDYLNSAVSRYFSRHDPLRLVGRYLQMAYLFTPQQKKKIVFPAIGSYLDGKVSTGELTSSSFLGFLRNFKSESKDYEDCVSSDLERFKRIAIAATKNPDFYGSLPSTSEFFDIFNAYRDFKLFNDDEYRTLVKDRFYRDFFEVQGSDTCNLPVNLATLNRLDCLSSRDRQTILNEIDEELSEVLTADFFRQHLADSHLYREYTYRFNNLGFNNLLRNMNEGLGKPIEYLGLKKPMLEEDGLFKYDGTLFKEKPLKKIDYSPIISSLSRLAEFREDFLNSSSRFREINSRNFYRIY